MSRSTRSTIVSRACRSLTCRHAPICPSAWTRFSPTGFGAQRARARVGQGWLAPVLPRIAHEARRAVQKWYITPSGSHVRPCPEVGSTPLAHHTKGPRLRDSRPGASLFPLSAAVRWRRCVTGDRAGLMLHRVAQAASQRRSPGALAGEDDQLGADALHRRDADSLGRGRPRLADQEVRRTHGQPAYRGTTYHHRDP